MNKQPEMSKTGSVSSSLNGNSNEFAGFEACLLSFKSTWNLYKDAEDSIKRKVLANCIGDCIDYYNKSIGTGYEENIKKQLFDFWSSYILVYGDDIFIQPWLKDYLKIVKVYEKKRGTIKIFPVDLSGDTNTFVFSFDEKYAKYFSVAILSLIKHIDSEKLYEIIVLYDSLSKETQRVLESIMPLNMRIRFICVKAYADVFLKNLKSKISSKHWSVPAFYDLLIPLLMPDYERVLYCDSDLIFQDNIDELFDISFDDKKLIAIKDTVQLAFDSYTESVFVKNQVAFIKQNLEIVNLQDYFNSGVMLFNVKDINREKYLERVLKSVSFSELPLVDQDALNFVFKDNVKYISERFNFQYHLYNDGVGTLLKEIAADYFQAAKHPRIVHYTTSVKPWNTPDCVFGTEFWNYARQSPFYEAIIYENLLNKQNSELEIIRTSFAFRMDRVITFIPRKLRGGFRCWQEHGFAYTLKRCWEKMRKFYQ